MISMILQMSGATLLYVSLTFILWRFWRSRPTHSPGMKLGIGLLYGLCTIASNHISINYGSMLINVRDIGPLAAGLFFDPAAGILCGLLGGAERFIIGEFFGIGSFTRVACGLSTCLAGILAAVLHRWVYEGTRPPVAHSFFLGAVMEVFHMYSVLLTNLDQMAFAYSIVQICSLPMILFTGLGVAACSAVVMSLSDRREIISFRTPQKKVPVYTQFQRWLLLITVGLFAASYILNYCFHSQTAYQKASSNLIAQRFEYQDDYQEDKNLKMLIFRLENSVVFSGSIGMVVDADQGAAVAGTGVPEKPLPLNAGDLELLRKNADGKVYRSPVTTISEEECLCVSAKLDDRHYLLLASSFQSIFEDRDIQLSETIFLEILIFTVMFVLIALLVENQVVQNLDRVNASLNRITAGDLNEIVAVETSSEFTELSEDINQTVSALRGYIDAEKQRMEADLKLAASIQESALPKVFHFPRNEFRIYALMQPARQVGGDFYDFFFTDVNQFALVIADVSGKSVPAALFMMRAQTAIKNFALSGNTPAKVLANANNVLCEGNEAEMFVTVWLGIIDLSTGTLRCANAGHEYPLLKRAGAEYEIVKDRHSLPLAAMEGLQIKEYELQLQPGDEIFVYTDGVPEAINEQEEAYGPERLLTKLNSIRDASEKTKLETVLQDLRDFSGSAEQFDDITMIGFTYLGSGGSSV